jgi:hypothetical protein
MVALLKAVRSVVPRSQCAAEPRLALHTVKTYGHDDHTLDAICGHSAKSKGGDYRKVNLEEAQGGNGRFHLVTG